MGAFYGSVQVQTEDRHRVIELAEQVGREKNIRMLVGPAKNGWVGVYPEQRGQDDAVAKAIAARFTEWVLHSLVHDDDVFAYWLYRDCQVVDSFWSRPGYFGDENLAEEQAMSGNPHAFTPLLGKRVAKLAPLLDRGDATPTFASETLEQFGRLLKISRLSTSFEYLKEREAETGHRLAGFMEVPRDVAHAERQKVREAKKHEREQVRQANRLVAIQIQRYQKEGILLAHEALKNHMVKGCAADDGFLVTWGRWNTPPSFSVHRAPWKEPTPIAFDRGVNFAELASDAAGRRVAIAVGRYLRAFNSVGAWERTAEITTEVEGIQDIALTPDGSILAYLTTKDLMLISLPSGRRILSREAIELSHVALHPDGKWIVLWPTSGISLALVSHDEPADTRYMLVGGGQRPQAMLDQARVRLGATIMQWRSNHPAVTEEHAARIRQASEKRMAEMLAKFHSPHPSRRLGAERVRRVGFTRDGRWIWCATETGMQVFEWEKLPREDRAEWETPKWRFSPRFVPETSSSRMIDTVIEDVQHGALVFSDIVGRVFHMDLSSGQTRMLIALPGQRRVTGLSLSADGNSLGIASISGQAMRDLVGIWEVWSYPALLAGA